MTSVLKVPLCDGPFKGGTGRTGPGQVEGDLHAAQGVGTGAGVGASLADWALADVLHAKKKKRLVGLRKHPHRPWRSKSWEWALGL